MSVILTTKTKNVSRRLHSGCRLLCVDGYTLALPAHHPTPSPSNSLLVLTAKCDSYSMYSWPKNAFVLVSSVYIVMERIEFDTKRTAVSCSHLSSLSTVIKYSKTDLTLHLCDPNITHPFHILHIPRWQWQIWMGRSHDPNPKREQNRHAFMKTLQLIWETPPQSTSDLCKLEPLL